MMCTPNNMFSYSQSLYFDTDPNPIPTLGMMADTGFFSYRSITGGNLIINPISGEIDLGLSDTGTYDIIYYIDTPKTSMVITGIIDGPLSGGTPKAVEFYVIQDIPDLSIYGFGSANNAGGSDGQEFTFPAISATSGTFIYVANESTQFNNWFGFTPDYTSAAANNNGDDAIELFCNGVVVDVFGDIAGANTTWSYMDGWAYRKSQNGPTCEIFYLPFWRFSGAGALNMETSNNMAAVPFPLGSYNYVINPDSCIFRIRLMETPPDPCALLQPPNSTVLESCVSNTLEISGIGGGIPGRRLVTNLFISEYIEGSGNNKCIEIYNTTGQSVNLAAGNYELAFYFNGNMTAATRIPLSGVVADDDVYVVCDDDAVAALLSESDQTTTSNFYNGNDAIALEKNGQFIDVIGRIGENPGIEWPGSGGTQNNTLVRNGLIAFGDAMAFDPFDASNEWTGLGLDDFSDIGRHTYLNQDTIATCYNVYDGDPNSGGTLIASGANPTITLPADGSDTVVWVTTKNIIPPCESDAVPLTARTILVNGFACVDLINVSLDANCERIIYPQDVVQGVLPCEGPFEIVLIDQYGQYIGNKILSDKMGQILTYQLINTVNGTKCWGKINVEDKYPPKLSCRDTTISCLEEIPEPQYEESCSFASFKELSRLWEPYDCDNPLAGVYRREIHVIDLWGNQTICNQNIFIRKASLDDLQCPEVTYINCDHPSLYSILFSDVSEEGFAHPKPFIVNGINIGLVDPPKIDGVFIGELKVKCNIVAHYDDFVFDGCGSSYTIRREWIIKDWCNDQEEVCIQYIKIIDTVPPELKFELSDTSILVGSHECKAHYEITWPEIDNECSPPNRLRLHYEVDFHDPNHPGKVINHSGTIHNSQTKILYLPVGDHKIYFRLQDECENVYDYIQKVWVLDETPPVPVCDEITQVTLDPDLCWSRIEAKDLDDGSHGNCCGQLHFAVASMDTIEYWRNYWLDYFKNCSSEYEYHRDIEDIKGGIEEWINIFVFDDYVDVTECGTENLVLRVYETCGMPVYDPHTFYGGPHEWYWWNISARFTRFYYWRLNEYIGYGDPRAEFICGVFGSSGGSAATQEDPLAPYPAVRWDVPVGVAINYEYDEHGPFKTEIGYDISDPSAKAEWEQRVRNKYPTEVQVLEAISIDKRVYFPHLYSDCMIEVIKDDKVPPVCTAPEDVTYYCDGVPYHWEVEKTYDLGRKTTIVSGWGARYAHDQCGISDILSERCYTQRIHVDILQGGVLVGYNVCCIEVPWDGGKLGYYGGPESSGYGYDQEDCGSQFSLLPDGWQPIYCWVWLLLDKYDDPSYGKPDATRYFGELEYSDHCGVDTVSYEDSGSLNECGVGVLKRTWTVGDRCKNESICSQKVIIKPRSDFEVVFPEDQIVECTEVTGIDPEETGRPVVEDDDCELIGINYVDERFEITEEGCYKILRTWTIIDWCVYDADQHFRHPDVIVDDRLVAGGDRPCIHRNLKDEGDGYVTYIQVIKVIDREAPEVICVREISICNEDADCELAEHEYEFGSATDNCSLPEEIGYRYIIKPGQSEDSGSWIYGHGASYTGNLELGIHDVYLIATDRCGNEDTCTTQIVVEDCKPPTPYCYDGIATVVMPSSQSVEVWAKDLDAGSFDNCTEKENLLFSFDATGKESSREFTCADIPDGKMQQIEVEIYVWDEAGNVDQCVTHILLQDGSGNVCADQIIAADAGNKEMGLSMSSQGKAEKSSKEMEGLNIREINGKVELYQNRPNPFQHETVIRYYLPAAQTITFNIFTVEGELVLSHRSDKQAGYHSWRPNTTQIDDLHGLFFYTLTTEKQVITRKMIKLK